MKVITNYKTTLSASMTSVQNTVPVVSIQTSDATPHTIVAADFDNLAFLVIEPGSANQEIVSVTGISGNDWTGAVRGLAFYGGSFSPVVANQKAHQAGSTVIMTNAHYYYDQLMDRSSNETVSGIKTFLTGATPVITDAPVAATDAANKAYVDLTATGSATYEQNIITGTAGENLTAGDLVYFKTSDQKWWKADSGAAATSVKVRLAFSQETLLANAPVQLLINGITKNLAALAAGTAYYVGSAGALSSTPGTFVRFVGWAQSATSLILDSREDINLVGQNGQEVYAADSVGTDAYAITLSPAITAYQDGQTFRFKAGADNTGNATLAVNGLTAKNILKNYNQVLEDKDILTGQIVEVVYDASQGAFQMISATSVVLHHLFGGTGADGALSINAGTTNIDLGNASIFIKNYTSISITGTAALTFTNPANTGTEIIFRSQGNVTITSNATPAIDLRGLGALGGNGGTGGGGAVGSNGTQSTNILDSVVHYGSGANGASKAGGAQITQASVVYPSSESNIIASRLLLLVPGASGGGGQAGLDDGGGTGSNGGNGGRGGGAMYIECNGSYNVTGIINLAGSNGVAGVNTAHAAGGGGGGGAGGMFLALYTALTADAGTYTVTGGTGGAGGTFGGGTAKGGGGGGASTQGAGAAGGDPIGGNAGAGGNGADGIAVRAQNTLFS